MKRLFSISLFVFILTIYGFYLNRYSFYVASDRVALIEPSRYYDYRGITHVHSSMSTGSGTPSEIVRTAQELGLDFLIFTEVNLHKHDQPLEGYFNSILTMEGGEFSYLDSRLLFYNKPSDKPPKGEGQSQVFFTDQLSQQSRNRSEGFFILAHPFLSRHQWSGEYPSGLDGIEIINLKRVLDVAWQERKASAIWSILTYWLNDHAALLRVYKDPEPEQELWDKLSKEQKTVGLLGTDATAKAILTPQLFLKFPSYMTSMGVASNRLLLTSELTGDFKSDKYKIMTAIQEGQVYLSLDILGDPRGFWAEVRTKSKNYLFGATVPFEKGSRLVINLPAIPRVPYEVRVIKDGELFATSNTKETQIEIHEAGNYRIVVRILVPLPFPEGKRWIPWIYTNPFYIR